MQPSNTPLKRDVNIMKDRSYRAGLGGQVAAPLQGKGRRPPPDGGDPGGTYPSVVCYMTAEGGQERSTLLTLVDE